MFVQRILAPYTVREVTKSTYGAYEIYTRLGLMSVLHMYQLLRTIYWGFTVVKLYSNALNGSPPTRSHIAFIDCIHSLSSSPIPLQYIHACGVPIQSYQVGDLEVVGRAVVGIPIISPDSFWAKSIPWVIYCVTNICFYLKRFVYHFFKSLKVGTLGKYSKDGLHKHSL